jgi:hypothetical protein
MFNARRDGVAVLMCSVRAGVARGVRKGVNAKVAKVAKDAKDAKGNAGV